MGKEAHHLPAQDEGSPPRVCGDARSVLYVDVDTVVVAPFPEMPRAAIGVSTHFEQDSEHLAAVGYFNAGCLFL